MPYFYLLYIVIKAIGKIIKNACTNNKENKVCKNISKFYIKLDIFVSYILASNYFIIDSHNKNFYNFK